MIEVEVTNYQSIAHAKFVIDGFTTLVGRNSLGKSAALRAVNAALTNQQGTDFIRWGQKFCEVRIKTGDLKILWHKEDNNNFYQINDGEPQTKIGRDEPPKEILAAGFKQIKTSGRKINLNYADQFNPLFLVDTMDSKGADLLTSVYGLDRLYKAIDLCSKEQRDNRDELRLREKDLSIVNMDLERFEGFDRVKESASVLQNAKKSLDKAELELEDLRKKYSQAQELATVCKRMAPIKEVSIPDSSGVQEGVAVYQRLQQYRYSVDTLTVVVSKLQGSLALVLPVESSVNITSAIDEYTKLRSLHAKYLVLSKEVENFSRVDSIQIPVPEVDVESVSKLRTTYNEAMRQKKELLGLDEDLKKVSAEFEQAQTALDSFEICPLCGNSRKK
jgi:hypothetical protein